MAAASIIQKYRIKHMITPRRHNVTAGRIAHYHTQINSDRTSTPSTAIADHGSAITARLSHVTAPHHMKMTVVTLVTFTEKNRTAPRQPNVAAGRIAHNLKLTSLNHTSTPRAAVTDHGSATRCGPCG